MVRLIIFSPVLTNCPSAGAEKPDAMVENQHATTALVDHQTRAVLTTKYPTAEAQIVNLAHDNASRTLP